MSKKKIEELSDAYSKLHSKKSSIGIDLYKDFDIDFMTNDFDVRNSGNSVHITAKISKENFNSIIDLNAIYILEYLQKKLNKKIL